MWEECGLGGRVVVVGVFVCVGSVFVDGGKVLLFYDIVYCVEAGFVEVGVLFCAL